MRITFIIILSLAAPLAGLACGGQSLAGQEQVQQTRGDAGDADGISIHDATPQDVIEVGVDDQSADTPPDSADDSGLCEHDCWEPTSDSGLEGSRSEPVAVRIGSRALFYGGFLFELGGNIPKSGGAIYDPSSDTWSRIADGPTYSDRMPFVFTGSEVLTLRWDELHSYSIAKDAWEQRASAPRPASKLVWTGTRAVAWGPS